MSPGATVALPPALAASNLESMNPAPVPADPMKGLQEALAGRYILQGELGRGGMAIVYLAYEVALDRPVALKLLPPEAAKTRWRERFLREARAAARLSHPNIVPIHAVDQVGEYVFFTMPYVDGETLAQRVEREGPLSAGEVMRVIKEVAQAVGYAHRHGVVHRDLKPDNIILERGSGRAMVMDFGIAQLGAQPGSDAGDYLEGSVPFMSPERVLGRPEDGRTDVYSLGATAYYAAAGRPPFNHAELERIMEQHVRRPAPPLSVVGQDGDDTLARVVERCLAKDPADRFQTADEVAEALARAPELRGGVPVSLRAFLTRSRRIARSAGGLSVAVLAAAITLIAGLRAGDAGTVLGATGFIALLTAAPLFALLRGTRRVLKAGYALDDVVAALAEDLEREREELVFDHGRNAARRGGALRVVAYGALGLAGLAVAWLAAGAPGAGPAVAVTFAALATSLGAGTAGLIRARRRRQSLAGQLWLRFWSGRLGRWTARVAGLGIHLPDRRDPVSQVPRVVDLMNTEIARIYAWIQGAETGETERNPDVTRRLEGNLTALKGLRDRLGAAGHGAPASASLSGDLAAAEAICEMVQLLVEANREVDEICRTPTHDA